MRRKGPVMYLWLYRTVSILLAVCFWCDICGANDCMPISEATAARIAQFLHDKFGFPPTTRIKITKTEVVGASCYRKLTVRSEGNAMPVQTAVYLSPDQQFLSRELMDTTVDLAEQVRSEQRKLGVELGEGGLFPTRGPQQALVTVTIFSDFQCPFCGKESENLREQGFTEASNVKLVFRNLPLEMHPWARPAAEMAACVYEQSNDAFWE